VRAPRAEWLLAGGEPARYGTAAGSQRSAAVTRARR